MKVLQSIALGLCAVALCGRSLAHPVPDIPVRSTFGNDGKLTVLIEIDPRCFSADALHAPYLENAALQGYSKAQKSELFEKAKSLIAETIEFQLLPKSERLPKFAMSFTTFSNKPLTWNAEHPEENTIKCAQEPVMVTAKCSMDAAKLTGYQIKAKKNGNLSVQFINYLDKEKQRLHVLFPGEDSYVLDLQAWAKSVNARAKPEKASVEQH